MMRLTPLVCPTCQAPARGTVERLAGVAEFTDPTEDGLVDYSGYTNVWWDEQETVTDRRGRQRLICPGAHEWWATVHEYAYELVEAPSGISASVASRRRRAERRSGSGA